jgi:hypothetical protein
MNSQEEPNFERQGKNENKTKFDVEKRREERKMERDIELSSLPPRKVRANFDCEN